jgi:hypothetical protein
MILNYFNDKTDLAAMKFLGSFYTVILDQGPHTLSLIADTFEIGGDRQFKTSSKFFESLVAKCELLDIISNYED